MGFSNEESQDLTKKDWVDVHRHGRWNTNFEQINILEFIGAKSFSDVQYAKHNTSYVNSLYIRYSLDDFLKENGYIIEKAVELGHDGEYPPSYSNIEYEYRKYRSCLHTGTYFLSKDNTKYVFTIDYGMNDVIFRLNGLRNVVPTAQDVLQDLINYSEKNNFLRGKKIDPRCSFISFDKKYSWEDLILDKRQKDEVRKNLSNLIEHMDIYRKNNITIKRGLIFSGPPGTGKTLLGKILCNVVDWTFIWVTPKYLEDSRDVSKVVSMARDLSPTILFLEDMDLYGSDRHSNGRLGVLGELMNQLDGIQENKDIITIATTNNIEILEKALLKRPGRFDKVITFNEPKIESRVRMLKHFSKGLNISSDVKFSELMDVTDKLTGAQLKELVSMAVLQALDKKSYNEAGILSIKKEHFLDVIPSVKRKDHSVGFLAKDDDDDDISSNESIDWGSFKRAFGDDNV